MPLNNWGMTVLAVLAFGFLVCNALAWCELIFGGP